jgi:hypothetical protein
MSVRGVILTTGIRARLAEIAGAKSLQDRGVRTRLAEAATEGGARVTPAAIGQHLASGRLPERLLTAIARQFGILYEELIAEGSLGAGEVKEGRAAYGARGNVVDLTRRSEDRSAAARAVVGKLRWLVEHQAEEEIGAILGTATAIVSILERGRARGRSRRRAG